MKKSFLFILMIIIIGVACQRSHHNFENIHMMKYSIDNLKILNAIDQYIISIDTCSNTSHGKSFFRIFIQNFDYNDVCIKITMIPPSSYFLEKNPPSLSIDRGHDVLLFYTGMENLFYVTRTNSKEIIQIYKDFLNKDILPDGSFDHNFLVPKYKTWKICLTNDSILINKNELDPFRPTQIKDTIILKDSIKNVVF